METREQKRKREEEMKVGETRRQNGEVGNQSEVEPWSEEEERVLEELSQQSTLTKWTMDQSGEDELERQRIEQLK